MEMLTEGTWEMVAEGVALKGKIKILNGKARQAMRNADRTEAVKRLLGHKRRVSDSISTQVNVASFGALWRQQAALSSGGEERTVVVPWASLEEDFLCEETAPPMTRFVPPVVKPGSYVLTSKDRVVLLRLRSDGSCDYYEECSTAAQVIAARPVLLTWRVEH